MKIKKGDNVIIISGKDKGKKGKVSRSLPAKDMIVVDGINVKKVTQRANKQGQKGQIIERPMPFHVSNASLIDPKTDKATRVGFEIKDKKKIRIALRSGNKI